VESLPNTRTGDVLGRQLLRSATSVGANYRSACRAQSKMKESDEIVAILTASSKTAKANLRKSINNQKSAINN
jgi:four helix bundle protein